MPHGGGFWRNDGIRHHRCEKEGNRASDAQIRFFVRGIADGSVSDAQIAAFCMAVLLNGMTDAECFVLTDAMAHSGEILPRPNFTGICADKHSTGGVSDSTTLVLVPVLCAMGVRCAKYSGRGLGHTGGTLDKLESFPGFNVNLTPEQFERQVEKIGGAVAGQTKSTVPADKRMYAVRDVTATVDSIPLIASSVMSKKLASFADVILLDVKYGDGAFMRAPEEAEKLARLMVSIGRAAGRKMCAAVTCMDAPLGDSIGCNAEVREAIGALQGEKNNLSALSLFHCEKIASLALGIPEEEARRRAEEAVVSGAALRKLAEIVEAQGGDARAVYDPSRLPLAERCEVIRALGEGVLKISALALGKACCALGGGRQKEGDEIDHSVAILLKRRGGDSVQEGETVAEVYYNKRDEDALALARGAFKTVQTYEPQPLVYRYIGEED